MRIDNKTAEDVLDRSSLAATQATGSESRFDGGASKGNFQDQVTLSSAQNLVSVASSMVPADKAAKATAIAQQVAAGKYELDSAAISKAFVRGHFRS